MKLQTRVEQELKQRIGTGPGQFQLTDGQGGKLTVEFTIIESLSCSIQELKFSVPALAQAGFNLLKKWAENLSQKVTYLLENIGPLELDPSQQQVLIRSTIPSQLPDGTTYYEMVLESQQGGTLVLKRYRSVKGKPGRQPVDLQLTHEVLLRLVSDIVAAIPAIP